MIRVRHLYISPTPTSAAGLEAGTGAPLVEREAIECVAGAGIVGDAGAGDGSVTFLGWSVFLDMRRELSVLGASPVALRRNIVTDGVNLAEWLGRRFEVQGVSFEGTALCDTAPWMNQAIGPGAEQWLRGRAGLRARIVSGGWIRRDSFAEGGRATRRIAPSDWPEHEFD